VNSHLVLWFHGIIWKHVQSEHELKPLLSQDQEGIFAHFKWLIGELINPFKGGPQPQQPIRQMRKIPLPPTVPQATTAVASTSSGSSSSTSSPNINPIP